LIQLADPDTLSNPAKQEIDMEKQLARQEIRIATTTDFETILTVRELETPNNTVELKFETVFAGANDSEARQTKAQFFVDRDDLQSIQKSLLSVVEQRQGS
jgi:hypothetical protein